MKGKIEKETKMLADFICPEKPVNEKRDPKWNVEGNRLSHFLLNTLKVSGHKTTISEFIGFLTPNSISEVLAGFGYGNKPEISREDICQLQTAFEDKDLKAEAQYFSKTGKKELLNILAMIRSNIGLAIYCEPNFFFEN